MRYSKLYTTTGLVIKIFYWLKWQIRWGFAGMTIKASFFRLNFPNLTPWEQTVMEKYLVQRLSHTHVYMMIVCRFDDNPFMRAHTPNSVHAIHRQTSQHTGTHAHLYGIANRSNLYRNSKFMRSIVRTSDANTVLVAAAATTTTTATHSFT